MDTKHSALRHLKTAWAWLRWPVALFVLSWLVYKNRADFAKLEDRYIDWPWFELGFVLCLGAIASTYVRWWMLVRALGFEFRLQDGLRIGFLGYLFNYIAPGAVGGDFVKAVILAREQGSRRLLAAATVLVDRLIGLIALFLTGSMVALIPTDVLPRLPKIIATYHIGGLVGLAAIVLLMLPAVARNPLVQRIPQLPVAGRFFGRMIGALILYQQRWRVIFLVMAISIAGHFAMLGSFYCCALAIHLPDDVPTFAEHLQFMPAAELAGVIVPLPGGVGALEGAIGHFYEVAGYSEGDGVLTGAVYRVISILIAGVGAICYAAIRRDLAQALESSDAEPVTAPAPPRSPLPARPARARRLRDRR